MILHPSSLLLEDIKPLKKNHKFYTKVLKSILTYELSHKEMESIDLPQCRKKAKEIVSFVEDETNATKCPGHLELLLERLTYLGD